MRTRRESERGMVTAEFAITMPVVIIVLYLAMTLTAALVAQIHVSDASREAARGWAMEVPDSRVRDLVAARAGEDATVSVSRRGNLIDVTVSKEVPFWFPTTLEVSSTMTALVEPGAGR